MTCLIATSVIRGSNQGDSHGGIYLVNLETDEILQPVDWNTIGIDWQGRGWDRGLRGIAFHDDHIFVAASDELFLFNQDFQVIDSFKSPYLKHCHEMSLFGNHLFITSTGFDSVIGFNIEKKAFDWALEVTTDGMRFGGRRYDPMGDDGPIQVNKLHLNSVFCDKHGMFISGLRTGNLLTFNGKAIGAYTTLPEGIHNARPFKDGILFNDTRSDVLRYEAPEERAAYRVVRYPDHKLENRKLDDSRIARQGFGRGLCVIDEYLIAGGSSPSTITLYDLRQDKPIKIVNISMDIRNAIHGLEVWPYAWPAHRV
ncbi:MAG: hypothetical protein AAGA36_02405 [Pseudomonadota bacterium]